MKKCGSKIALSLIAALAMVFAFATCSIDDMVADSSENGECGATHEWNEGEIIKAATESDDGEKKFTCTKCGKTKTEAIPALGHSHTVASGWTFDEAHHWHDVSCGNESHKDKAAHEWNEGEITKAATESDDGEKKFTCVICGSTKTEAIPALDHNHTVASEWMSDEEFHWHEASCEKEEHRTDKTAHEWNDGKVTTAPTCTAEGERTYACTTCGKTRTEPVAANGHEWNEGEITKAATESDDGEKTFTCTTCYETRTEAIPALGHEHKVASEWTSDEEFHWHEASCGREAHRTDKTEHTWDTGEITTAPTCTTAGKRTYTCTVCGKTRTEPVATSEHANMTVSLTNNGERQETCPTCGYKATSAWTKETLSELSDALKNYAEKNAKIKVVGELSDTNAIAAALLELSSEYYPYDPSKLVALDLGETTGLTTVSFKNCRSLESIILPNSVTTIEKYAFYGCRYLTTNITIPDGMTEIGDYTFFDCQNITNITIPNSVTKIGEWAFYNCRVLENITIPNSVTKIGEHAFDGCKNFTKVELPEGLTEIADYVFYNCSLYYVNIPSSVTKIGKRAFLSSGLRSVPTLPEGLTEIGERAFVEISLWSTELVEIPSSVTEIGPKAFYNTSYLLRYGIKFKNTAKWYYYSNEYHTVSSPCDVSDSMENAKKLVYAPSSSYSSETEHACSKYGMFKWQ